LLRIIVPIVAFILLFAILYMYLVHIPSKAKQPIQSYESPTKPVVMIIIDSIMDEPLQTTIKQGKAPALQFLMKNGHYYPKMVSSFPTMSVSIDSSLLTGTYPDQHRVPALVWYDETDKRLISYGSARKEIMKIGVREVFTNSLFALSHTHLSNKVKTIHEELGQTASINTLVYRGNHYKQLNVPRVLKYLGLMDKNDGVYAPAIFSYGLLSFNDPTNKNTHLWKAFGFNDKFATTELNYLIEQNQLPSFSLVYLSDNDKRVHKNGVKETKGIEEADKQLQEILNSYDSWEDALNNNVWIVMGDSGQTYIGNQKEQALIDLRELLKDYKIHKINKPINEQDQIVLGLNERMTFIYLLDEELKEESLASHLRADDRIDIIAWAEGERVNVISGDDDGILSFKPTGEIIDQYGQTWTVEGNERILDLYIENNHVYYKDYPDGLARLYSSFFSHPGRYLVVNSKPGYEFVGEGSPTHVGGASHGSLYKDDTYFPMIVTGTNTRPKHERIVDLKEWILQLVKENSQN
jgi:predicted AlkP superfamily pyrophosphatase or phosphodiesterase